MLRHRLTFGPLMIVAAFATFWLDELVDGIDTPRWLLHGALPFHDTLPRGSVLFVVLVGVGVLAALELARILRQNGIDASSRMMCGAALIGLAVSSLVPVDARGVTSTAIVSSSAACVLLVSLAFYSRDKTVEGVVAATGGTLLSFVYLGLLLGFMMVIRREHSAWVLLWILLVTKSCDIGAYFTGRAIGRRKLIAWLSPGKTWEGLGGGIATSALVGALGVWVLNSWVLEAPSELSTGPLGGAVAGVIFGIVGQAGDLIASLLKRDAGIKDAGSALPGFGGVMDVVDSPILVAPVAYWWLTTIG